MSSHSIVSLPRELSILKTRIPLSVCSSLLIHSEPFIEDVSCNLKNTKRTGWDVHLNEQVRPHSEEIMEHLLSGLKYLFLAPYDNLFQDRNPFRLGLHSSWVAWYGDESTVLPHVHGALPYEWSFCVYLDAPEDGTSISFFLEKEHLVNQPQAKINVMKGDVVCFPASLPHFVEKCTDGRAIYSGNFYICPNE